jgi:tRNA(adenine34) deaminase
MALMGNKYFMSLAIKEAEKSLRGHGIPVGAILVRDNRIVGRGNRSFNNAAFLDHAEIQALRSMFKKYKRAMDRLILYTTFEPCVMCFGALLHVGVKKIVYAMEDPFGGATRVPRSSLPKRNQEAYPSIIKGVLKKDASVLFKKYLSITNDPFWKNKENPIVRNLG